MIPTASCTTCKFVHNNLYIPVTAVHNYFSRFIYDWLKVDFRKKFKNKSKSLYKYDGISKEVQNIFKSLFSKPFISANPSEIDLRCLEKVYA